MRLQMRAFGMGLLLALVATGMVRADIQVIQAPENDAAATQSVQDAKGGALSGAQGTTPVDQVQQAEVALRGVTMTKAEVTDLMSKGKECMNYSKSQRSICCKYDCSRAQKDSTGCCRRYRGTEYQIGYWEPSAVIEVSCRTGYSMLAPGAVPARGGGSPLAQTCVGANKPGNGRYFFEARVWAVNGYEGKLRHQAMGNSVGEQMRHCSPGRGSSQGKGDDTKEKEFWGYGIKWKKFSRGPENGPGGSYEAYISDKDPTWATDDGGSSSPPQQKECKIGSTDLANCWGPMTSSGWVNHPNPKVGAALVAWRAHERAKEMNKVSPPGQGGYKMMMDYPALKPKSPFGETMGVSGSKGGSACFQPGDSGPDWFGGMKPEEIPAFVNGLKAGNASTVAEINPGVYIFTVWVHTSCTRYAFPARDPTPICHYKGKD